MLPQLIMKARISTDASRLMAKMNPRPILEEAGNRKVSRMVRGLRRSGEPMAGEPPVSRTGARGFAGRMTYRVARNGRTLVYGNSSVYARILHFGGTIRPRPPQQMLTVPISPEARGKRAKDFPGIFRIGDILFTARQRGRGANKGRGTFTELTPLFVLKKFVTLDPHPWGIQWDDVDHAALMSSLRRRAASGM